MWKERLQDLKRVCLRKRKRKRKRKRGETIVEIVDLGGWD